MTLLVFRKPPTAVPKQCSQIGDTNQCSEAISVQTLLAGRKCCSNFFGSDFWTRAVRWLSNHEEHHKDCSISISSCCEWAVRVFIGKETKCHAVYLTSFCCEFYHAVLAVREGLRIRLGQGLVKLVMCTLGWHLVAWPLEEGGGGGGGGGENGLWQGVNIAAMIALELVLPTVSLVCRSPCLRFLVACSMQK